MKSRTLPHLPVLQFRSGTQQCRNPIEVPTIGSCCLLEAGWNQIREHDSGAQFLLVFHGRTDAHAIEQVWKVLHRLDSMIVQALATISPLMPEDKSLDIDELSLEAVILKSDTTGLEFGNARYHPYIDYPSVTFKDDRIVAVEWTA